MFDASNSSLLIVGGDSGIGLLLTKYFNKKFNVITTTRKRDEVTFNNIYFNLSDSINKWEIPNRKIETAIICAAITSISYCEKNPLQSFQVNYLAVVDLVKKLVENGIYVIFPSTNLVYEGSVKFQNNIEHLNPKTMYGKHKLLAEQAILNLDYKNISILRLSKVLGGETTLFQAWVKELMMGKEINPVKDLVFAPSSYKTVSDCFSKINNLKPFGVFQLSATSDISYEDAAYYIADYFNFDKTLIRSINAKDCGISIFSQYSTMECRRVMQELAIKPDDPYHTLRLYLDEFVNLTLTRKI